MNNVVNSNSIYKDYKVRYSTTTVSVMKIERGRHTSFNIAESSQKNNRVNMLQHTTPHKLCLSNTFGGSHYCADPIF